MRRPARSALSLAALAATLLASAPARADFTAFLNATCGVNCADPVGEQAADAQYWSSLQAMGTTSWIGSTLGGTTIDASSLIAASRVAGAPSLDAWLKGDTSITDDVALRMQSALVSTAGLDVSLITGVDPGAAAKFPAATTAPTTYDSYGSPYTGTPYNGSLGAGSSSSGSLNGISNLGSNLASSLGSSFGSSSGLGSAGASLVSSAVGGGAIGSALGNLAGGALGGSMGGGGSSGYCMQSIDQAQNANAQKYVNAMQSIATSGQYGFSQNGGQPISSGQASGSGYFSGGCLSQLMQGNMDLLFKPPQLSSLLSQLGSMFGGGAKSGCAAAQSIMTMVGQSMPNSIFRAGNGGFFPAAAFGGGGLNAGSSLMSLGSMGGGGVSTSSISRLLPIAR